MRNIFFLLIATLCLQACNDDNEEDWAVDSLAVVLSGEFINNGESFNVGDGNWGINLKPEVSGTFKLDIQTDKAWNISIENVTNEDEQWITPSVTEGNGKASVDVAIDANSIPQYRKASIVITTKGEIPVNKKITIIQKNMGVLEVTWEESHLLTADEMVFGPNERTDMVIGTCNSEGDEIAISPKEGWAKIEVENGNIILNLSKFEDEGDGEEFHQVTVNITNLNGGVNKQISLKQYSKEILVEKTNWSIEKGNENTLSQTGNEVGKLIDGDNKTFWERQYNNNGEGGPGGQNKVNFPYEFVIDFKGTQLINTVDIWQRDWHTGCIKTVQLLFSNDNPVDNDEPEWLDGGIYTLAESQEECRNHREPYTLALSRTVQVRCMKLRLLSNVWNSVDANLAELSVYLK